MTTFAEETEIIRKTADGRLEELCAHLIPGGKKSGHLWAAGSIHGDKGDSWNLNLATGVFCDWAAGEKSQQGGINLWMQARQVNFLTARQELANWLGLQLHHSNGSHKSKLNGAARSEKANDKGAFDWYRDVRPLTEKHAQHLREWRGLSEGFISWLAGADLIGLYNGGFAFPIHGGEAQIVSVHYLADEGKKAWLHNKGATSTPLVIGRLKEAAQVHVFESTWDGLAFCDRTEAHQTDSVAVVITRGANHASKVHGLIPETAKPYAWPQNDSPKSNGCIPSEDWVKGIGSALKRSFYRVQTPTEYEDLNAWTRDGNATPGQLAEAIQAAALITPEVPASESAPVTLPERCETSGAYRPSPGLAEALKGVRIYYDSPRRAFWIENDRGNWIQINAQDVQRDLEERGFKKKAAKDERVSQVDAILTGIQRSHDVDYAGSLAGYRAGVYMILGKQVLVSDSPTLITPAAGEWPHLKGILLRMLGENQQKYLFGWLKVALEALYAYKPRVGQTLVLAGPKDCGKSLLQDLITILLGGRSAKAHRYMSGQTPFNSELFGAEHLMIEDEPASTDIRTRKHFGGKIKEISANVTQSCHPKQRVAITLTPFWRLSVSVNDEPEDLMILPPLADSLDDKMTILKAERHEMPMPTATPDARETFLGALRAELPAFVDFLLKWEIPADLVSQRYGVRHFQHPDLLTALGALAPETRLLEILDSVLFNLSVSGPWTGSATDLERRLTSDGSQLRRESEKLFYYSSSCGRYLGLLQKSHPDRFKSNHTNRGNVWTIQPPNP